MTSKSECSLPADDRKEYPLFSGLLAYFPNALAEVSALSKKGNDQHNPGEPMFWARWKSKNHADCLMRHLVDYDKEDTDGVLHVTKVAWRALALLQELLERERGLVAPRGVKDSEEPEVPIPPFNRSVPFVSPLSPDPFALVHDYAPKEEEPAPEAEGTLYDWTRVSADWKFIATDCDGASYYYTHKPVYKNSGFWYTDPAPLGSRTRIRSVFAGNLRCLSRDSLEQRPKNKKEKAE